MPSSELTGSAFIGFPRHGPGVSALLGETTLQPVLANLGQREMRRLKELPWAPEHPPPGTWWRATASHAPCCSLRVVLGQVSLSFYGEGEKKTRNAGEMSVLGASGSFGFSKLPHWCQWSLSKRAVSEDPALRVTGANEEARGSQPSGNLDFRRGR